VTGSSQGIGLALARGLAEHGAEIVLNGRDPGKRAAASGILAAAGHPVSVAGFDVTDGAAVRAGIDAIEADTGPIDILIDNAGMQFRTPLQDSSCCARRWPTSAPFTSCCWARRQSR